MLLSLLAIEVTMMGPDLHNGALLKVVTMGNHRMAQLLLSKGADVNARGGYYGSALQWASAKGHEQMVQMFLQHGAK